MSIPGLPFMAGSLHLYLKNQGMKLTVERKKQGLEALTPKEQEAKNLRDQMADIRKSNVTAAITTKLDTGRELTEEEMSYLRAHNPQLYQKALEIRREREAYRKSLHRCRTKEESARLNVSKLQSFAAQAKAVPRGGGDMAQLHRRMAAVGTEHSAFLQSSRYRALPSEREPRDKRRKKPLPPAGNSAPLLPLPPSSAQAAAKLAQAARRLNVKI